MLLHPLLDENYVEIKSGEILYSTQKLISTFAYEMFPLYDICLAYLHVVEILHMYMLYVLRMGHRIRCIHLIGRDYDIMGIS